MLVLRRNANRVNPVESEIVINFGADQVVIQLVEVCGLHSARIGITAPQHIQVHRREIWERIQSERNAQREKP